MTSVVIRAKMADVEEMEVVVAHNERATLRVGDVFLKIDTDQTRLDVEVEAMAMAPIPTPEVLWRKPPVLALAALPGTALGRLGEPSAASAAAWAAAGSAARKLHEAPLPPWPGERLDEVASRLDSECEWLVTNGVLPTEIVTRNRRIAEAALRPWTPVFVHGDLQITHVFVDGDEITGVVDWSEAGHGDALYDLAVLTLGHEEHLADVVAGYGTHVDLNVIRAWWSLRSLLAARWLIEHGFDPSSPGCEFDVLRSRCRAARLCGARGCGKVPKRCRCRPRASRGAGPPRLVLVREPGQLGIERAHQPLAFSARPVELTGPHRCVADDDDRTPARLDDNHLRAARVARRRHEPDPGQELELAVDRHVPHSGRIDPLADRVVVLAARVVELPALDGAGLPVKRWLPPQWSKCRCASTTTSIPARSKSCSLSGMRRGSRSATAGWNSVMPVSTSTRASGWSMTCT